MSWPWSWSIFNWSQSLAEPRKSCWFNLSLRLQGILPVSWWAFDQRLTACWTIVPHVGWNWIMCSLVLANTRYSAVSENIASLQDTIALMVVVQYMKIESYCHIPNPTGHKTSPSKGCCFHPHHWQTTQQVAIFVIVKSGKMAKRGGGCWVAAPKNKFSLSHAKLSSAKPTCLLPNS